MANYYSVFLHCLSNDFNYFKMEAKEERINYIYNWQPGQQQNAVNQCPAVGSN